MAVPAPRRLCQVAASAPPIPPGYLNPAALSQLQTPGLLRADVTKLLHYNLEVPPPGTALGRGRGRVGQDDCKVKSREGGAASGAERAGRRRPPPPDQIDAAGAGCAARPRCPDAARAPAGAAAAFQAGGQRLGLQLVANCLCLGGRPEFVLQPPQVE